MSEIFNNATSSVFNASERFEPDQENYPGWSLQTFVDSEGRVEGVVFRLDRLSRTPVGLLTNNVNGSPTQGIQTAEYVVDGCGWVILKEPGKEAEARWIDTKPRDRWQEDDEPLAVEIAYPPGTLVAYAASSLGLTGCYLGSPAGITEEIIPEEEVPDDFLHLYRNLSETPPIIVQE